MDKEVKVLIVSGSARELAAFAAVIKRAPGITLAGAVDDSSILMDVIGVKKPDAILIDIDTLRSNPVAAVGHIMRDQPLPIILMTARERDTDTVFESIAAGALTVVKKPVLVNAEDDDKQAAKVLRDIKTYSGVSVIRHVWGGAAAFAEKEEAKRKMFAPTGRIVVIASSTGGPHALGKILPALPSSFPMGIVIAQHISEGFTPGLVDWLDNLCAIKVTVAADGEKIKPGHAYFPPDGYHITVSRFDSIGLDNGPVIAGHRPSCNKLLLSAAKTYRDKAIGVILSGMGEDGAVGLKEMHDAGAKTFAQDEATCAVFGMPKIAVKLGAVSKTTPLDEIADEIAKAAR